MIAVVGMIVTMPAVVVRIRNAKWTMNVKYDWQRRAMA